MLRRRARTSRHRPGAPTSRRRSILSTSPAPYVGPAGDPVTSAVDEGAVPPDGGGTGLKVGPPNEREWENSEVVSFESVAVAVKDWPGATGVASTATKLAWPAPSVVTESEPTSRWPSPTPNRPGSLPKSWRRYWVSGAASSVPEAVEPSVDVRTGGAWGFSPFGARMGWPDSSEGTTNRMPCPALAKMEFERMALPVVAMTHTPSCPLNAMRLPAPAGQAPDRVVRGDELDADGVAQGPGPIGVGADDVALHTIGGGQAEEDDPYGVPRDDVGRARGRPPDEVAGGLVDLDPGARAVAQGADAGRIGADVVALDDAAG